MIDIYNPQIVERHKELLYKILKEVNHLYIRSEKKSNPKLDEELKKQKEKHSIDLDFERFIHLVFAFGHIDKEEYFEILGKYPPIPPDPEEERKFEDFKNRLWHGELSLDSIRTYKESSQERYRVEVDQFINIKLTDPDFSGEELEDYYRYELLTEGAIQDYLDRENRSDEIGQILKTPEELLVLNRPVGLEKIEHGRTDVILIGAPTTGKTMFLSSFLDCLEQHNNLDLTHLTPTGRDYCELLKRSVREGILFDRTKNDTLVSMPADLTFTKKAKYRFQSDKELILPINLIEMPGEAFRKAYNKNKEDWPKNLKECFWESKNPKIIFFMYAVDNPLIEMKEIETEVSGEETTIVSQQIGSKVKNVKITAEGFYKFFIDKFTEYGLFKEGIIIGLGLIFTKWDQYDPTLAKSPIDFANEECSNFDNNIHALSKGKKRKGIKFDFERFKSSIGKVDPNMNSYVYSPEGLNEIYKWILKIAPYKND